MSDYNKHFNTFTAANLFYFQTERENNIVLSVCEVSVSPISCV